MRIKLTTCALFLFLALNAYAQQSQDFEIKKEEATKSKQTKVQKSKPVLTNKNKAGKSKPFIPTEKVSPDIPVAFPADI